MQVQHGPHNRSEELDVLLGDTHCEITDYETQIMHSLQNTILEMSQVLMDVVKLSAKLDCLISLSLVAKEMGYICPHVTSEGNIEIIKGRHPLQELCVASCVPNDVCSGGTEGKIKIITGPNASGKSVYLKQVALIVYMSHIGSFVPAEKAQIPTVDKILTHIQTFESVSIDLSTFLLHLNQMPTALNYATEKSLVIIDEFGKGTEATMEALRNDKELVFLYHLIDGRADSSFAHNAALQVGLSQEIVQRAMKISEMLKNQEPISACDSEAIAEKLRSYKMVEEKFFNLDLFHSSFDIREFLNVVSDAISESSPSVTTSTKDTSSKSS